MQEEIEQKSFNIMISTTKLSARTVLRAVKAAFRLYQSKTSQGKQSVRTLLRQNRGVSSVEISKTGIRGLERYAKKYGIDYAIRKDTSEVPPRYLVFFKAPDAEAFNSAFKEYSASLLNKDKRPSVLARLQELVQAAAELPGKVRHIVSPITPPMVAAPFSTSPYISPVFLQSSIVNCEPDEARYSFPTIPPAYAWQPLV